MNREELENQVRELKELKLMQEELQTEITAIEDKIKTEMTKQNANELQVGIFKIRYVDVTSNRFDTTSFKKIYSDLYNQFLRQSNSKRFSIV